MRKLFCLLTIAFISCNHNSEMNTLLSNKKTLEDSLARMRYRGQALKDSALAHSKTADSVSAADAYIQNEIKADDMPTS